MNNSKTYIAYGLIKQKILEGELPPLSDVSEDKLQQELNISRTPIREALQLLQKEGFVYIYPRKGTIVTEVTSDLIQEVYQMRELNEPFIAVQASHTISEDWLLLKRNDLENPPKDLDANQLRRYYIELDWDLHISLLKFCNNRFLQNLMNVVYDHNHRFRIKVSNPKSDYDQSVQEHLAIINALLKKDSNLIEQVVKHHIVVSKQLALEYYMR